jgi:hypothetical protein
MQNDYRAVGPHRTLHISWELDGNAHFATARHGLCHLAIERLPDQDAWDWIVWEGRQPDIAQCGIAESVSAAIEEAYLVARTWNGRTSDG